MNDYSPGAAWIDLPAGSSASALRAGLMAMRVPPNVLPASGPQRNACLQALAAQPQAAIFIDLSRTGALTPSLLELDASVPASAGRSRIFLTRVAGGHVSEGDRRWVRALGFADLLTDFDPLHCEGQLRLALDTVAGWLDRPKLPRAELSRYVRGMNVELDASSPRAVVRALTGLSAEALADQMHTSTLMADRTYRLRTYPRCFVGSEGVAWLAQKWQCGRSKALALGQALFQLGLLVHVAQEHPFLDDALFYRMAWSPEVDQLDLGQVFAELRSPQGPAIADRAHLGRTYPQCWVGTDAVTWLARRHQLARHDAWLLLYRLMQFGLIAHVTRARPLIDGAFFYRYAGLPEEVRS